MGFDFDPTSVLGTDIGDILAPGVSQVVGRKKKKAKRQAKARSDAASTLAEQMKEKNEKAARKAKAAATALERKKLSVATLNMRKRAGRQNTILSTADRLGA